MNTCLCLPEHTLFHLYQHTVFICAWKCNSAASVVIKSHTDYTLFVASPSSLADGNLCPADLTAALSDTFNAACHKGRGNSKALLGIQGTGSQIKQNQQLLHINHTAVQLLRTLYNLTISSSHCSSCACDCVCINVAIFLFPPSSAAPLQKPVPSLCFELYRATFHAATLLTQDYAAGLVSLELSLCVFIARLCCCSGTFSWLPFGQPLALMRRCRTGGRARYETAFHCS